MGAYHVELTFRIRIVNADTEEEAEEAAFKALEKELNEPGVSLHDIFEVEIVGREY